MDFSLLLTIAVIHSVALISPGPDFAIMLKIASSQPRGTALGAALGISVAILAHTLLSLTGVSLVIRNSDSLYLVVQLAGAGYLAWMGFGALRSAMAAYTRSKAGVVFKSVAAEPSTVEHAVLQEQRAKVSLDSAVFSPISKRRGFMLGLYTNLLNPKALVFFMTLFSALITPTVTLSSKLAAAALMFSLSFLWFGTLATLLSKPRIQHRLQGITPIIDAIVGVIFMSVALVIMFNLV